MTREQSALDCGRRLIARPRHNDSAGNFGSCSSTRRHRRSSAASTHWRFLAGGAVATRRATRAVWGSRSPHGPRALPPGEQGAARDPGRPARPAQREEPCCPAAARGEDRAGAAAGQFQCIRGPPPRPLHCQLLSHAHVLVARIVAKDPAGELVEDDPVDEHPIDGRRWRRRRTRRGGVDRSWRWTSRRECAPALTAHQTCAPQPAHQGHHLELRPRTCGSRGPGPRRSAPREPRPARPRLQRFGAVHDAWAVRLRDRNCPKRRGGSRSRDGSGCGVAARRAAGRLGRR
jgi:hypothetical protein